MWSLEYVKEIDQPTTFVSRFVLKLAKKTKPIVQILRKATKFK